MADLIVSIAGGQPLPHRGADRGRGLDLGLAVPVTASYIIAAAITAPALTKLGVPDVAAHMFIFYYAVLSEVSPPTALSPFAAAAITGGNPFRTMMVTWKYTLPAFLVPFMITLNKEDGIHLLALGDPRSSCAGDGDGVPGNGSVGRGRRRLDCRASQLAGTIDPHIPAAGLLLYTGPFQDAVGLVLMLAGIAIHWFRVRGEGSGTGGEQSVVVT